MPSPEGEKRRPKGRIPPERKPEPEQEPPWYRAARYTGEAPAGRAYFQAQETIFSAECDLSAYRFLLEDIYHVAVLGGIPTEVALQQQIETILYAEGTPTQLPDDVLHPLNERRQLAERIGPWVEGHYRPGKGIKRRK